MPVVDTFRLQDKRADYHDPPDLHDKADFKHGGGAPARADPLDPLANFIKELQDLSSMALIILPMCLNDVLYYIFILGYLIELIYLTQYINKLSWYDQ